MTNEEKEKIESIFKQINNSLSVADKNIKTLDHSDKVIISMMQFTVNMLFNYDPKIKEFFINGVSGLLKDQDKMKNVHPYFLSYLQSLADVSHDSPPPNDYQVPKSPAHLTLIIGGKDN